MSPILDLENLTPISLEELGEIKQLPSNEIKDIELETKELNKEIIENISIKEKTNKKPFKQKINSTSKTNKLLNSVTNIQQSSELLLSIKDCEVLSGISKVSIRKAIKEKEINYILEDGKYKISFKELLKWCYSSTRRKNVFNSQGIGRYVNEWNIILK